MASQPAIHQIPAPLLRRADELVGLVEKGQVTIEAKALHFSTEAQLLDYVKDIKAELPRSEDDP